MTAAPQSKRPGVFLSVAASLVLAACATTPEPAAGQATDFSVYVLATDGAATLAATPWTLERPSGRPTLGRGKALVEGAPLIAQRAHTMNVRAQPGDKLTLTVETAAGTRLPLSPIELFDDQGQALAGDVRREQGLTVLVEPAAELQTSVVRRLVTFPDIKLSGASEVPAVRTDASGDAFAVLINRHVFVVGTFQKLQGRLLSDGTAHVHRGAAGTNGPVVFDLDAAADRAGNGFVVGLERLAAADLKNFTDGNLYLNIHSSFSPTGEIRGQLSDAQPGDAPGAKEVLLGAATSAQFGDYVTDAVGNSVYLFTKDVRGSDTSVCSGACAVAWPPVTFDPERETLAVAAGSDLNAALLGSFRRGDGTVQATYNGWPLHRFAKDAGPGDTNGQGVGGTWFLLKPDGTRNQPSADVALTTRENAAFGPHLTDDAGNSLYLFTNDARGSNTSACSGACATTWPPVTLEDGATPVVDPNSGLSADRLGSFRREDGTTQVTYNGWPLHLYEPDGAPGDILGQNVGGVWFIVSPAGVALRPSTY